MKSFVILLCLNLAMAIPGEAAWQLDPVCGFRDYQVVDAAMVTRGLRVDLFSGDLATNGASRLRLFVSERPGATPVDLLQVEHEKIMHLMGAREDLQGFFHVHPLKTGSGMWEVEHGFTQPGRYILWCDIKYRGLSYCFKLPEVTVPGEKSSEPVERSFEQTKRVSDYEVALAFGGPLVAGETNQFYFSFKLPGDKPLELDNFLGAPMHLIIVKGDFSQLLHAHPVSFDEGTGMVGFRQRFPTAGVYKLFAQFRPKQAGLEKDGSILAEFFVNVELR